MESLLHWLWHSPPYIWHHASELWVRLSVFHSTKLPPAPPFAMSCSSRRQWRESTADTKMQFREFIFWAGGDWGREYRQRSASWLPHACWRSCWIPTFLCLTWGITQAVKQPSHRPQSCLRLQCAETVKLNERRNKIIAENDEERFLKVRNVQ